MKLKHLRKIILSLTISTLMILSLASSVVYGKARNDRGDGHLFAKEQMARVWYNKSTGNFENKGVYKLLDKGIVYQILEVKDASSTEILGNNFYCLNAEEGDTWRNVHGGTSIETTVEYDKKYDLKKSTDKKTNQNGLQNTDNVYSGNNIEKINNYYSEIVWLLDNFYLPDGDINAKNEYLAKAGIKYGKVDRDEHDTTYYYEKTSNIKNVFNDETENLYTNLEGRVWGGKGGYCIKDTTGTWQDVVLPDELIETVQQAVLWYFINGYNYLETSKDALISNWLLDGTTSKAIAEDDDTGKMYQEQASILYNYLVYSAQEHPDYVGKEAEGKVTIDRSKAKIVKNADNTYKVGPIKLSSTGLVSIKDIEVYDITGTTKQTGYDVSSTATGTDIYIDKIPASTNGNVKIKVNYDSNTTTQTLWTASSKTEQPLVELVRGNKAKEAEVVFTNENVFDLALRKIIKQVKDSSGNIVSIINEDEKDSTRNITVYTSTIPDTATYKHRKDPVVVKTGYEVTYEIKIYNEGDIDGYASKVVDQLPSGLKSILGKDKEITTTKGNTYVVDSYDNNKLVLKIKEGTTPTSLKAYNESSKVIDSDTLTLKCEVTQTPDNNSNTYMTNIAYISEAKDSTGTEQVRDRKNTESMPSKNPFNENKITVEGLNTTDKSKVYHGGTGKSIFNETDNTRDYFAGYEDDDDFETVVLLPQEFDLKLIKYIAEVNGVDTGKRNITVDTSKLNTKGTDGKKIRTANYNVSKLPITVKTGDIVTYTFRIYNEADVDGYASEISENIPEGLEYLYSKLITDAEIDADTTLSAEEKAAIKFNRNQLWTFDDSDPTEKTIRTTYLSKDTSTTNLIKAFDKKNGILSYKEVSVKLKVTSTDSTKVIRNEAAITEDTDKDGKLIDDRDSKTIEWNKEDSDKNYDGDQNPKYEEDDEDYDNIKLARFDLSLRKFIAAISEDANIEEGEYLTDNGKIDGKYTREPQVDTSKLKTGAEQTAIYNHPKDAVSVNKGDYVLYTIRVYNEGDQDGYASKITDYLPEYLNYIDGTVNKNNGWVYNSTDRSVTTDKLKYVSGSTTNELKAYDRVNDKLDYRDVQILCRVSDSATINTNITNIAEIAEYQDKNGNVVNPDADSTSNNIKLPTDRPGYEGNRSGKNASDKYYPGQEDDDDFEKVVVPEVNFDLALRKFITNISGEDVTTRIPEVKFADNKITYEHPKDVVKVVVGDTVTYTLRIFNEGKINGFAQTITDDIPEYLEYLPRNATNVAYRWKMYDKDGNETTEVKDAVKIVSDYTSKENGEKMMADSSGKITTNPNLLKAFDSSKEISETNPAYVDLKVAFKVKDPNSSKYIIKNKAQISEDADEKGNRIDDIDSVPDKWNEGEDDQDYENVSVQYFDLALLKYVSEVRVTENGTTTITKTGNKGDKNDIMPKVEIHRKKIKTTKVKFIYTIKVTNEGDIPGYAKEITDYIPKGLEFYEEDNKGWTKKKDGVITTDLLSDRLLQPGKSATVKVTFRWKNSGNNMGVKTNIAEISDDENEKGIPDRDSTPGNKKEGEDDIDDADVILSTKTGVTENVIKYVSGAAIILLVLAGGVVLIKKFVL